MTKKLVFLGGTCGKNNWRDDVITFLVAYNIDRDVLFNPVVPNWTPAFQEQEDAAKREASHIVFYIADPKEEGLHLSAYSMVEATMALYDKPERTVVVFDYEGLTGHAKKAQEKVEKDLRKRFPGAYILASKDEAIRWLRNALV